jgi:integrase
VVKLLTDAAVRKYAPGPTRRVIRDAGARSLYLVIAPSGARSWMMRFRRPNGKPAKLVLGPYDLSGRELKGEPQIGQPLSLPAARQLAAEVHRRRALGDDVVADHKARKHRQRAEIEERAETNFSTCVRQFLAEHKVKKSRTRPRRWRETARLIGLTYPPGSDPAKTEPEVIKGGLAERWAEKDVRDIDAHEIWSVVDEARRTAVPGIDPRSPGLSDARPRALFAALSSLFGWLLEHRKIAQNPCSGLKRPQAPDARDRVLSNTELIWFWRATDAIGVPFGTIFKLLLLLGQRLREVAGLRRDELSADGTVWSIPASRTKNRRAHVVPLPPAAQALIAAVRGDQQIIFSSTGHTMPSGWSRAKARLDKAMFAVAREDGNTTIRPFRLHDLRRCAVTGMAELGIRPDVIELTVNHVSGSRGGIAGVYNRSELMDERKAALERWAAHVNGLVSGRPAKVVSLKQRRRK